MKILVYFTIFFLVPFNSISQSECSKLKSNNNHQKSNRLSLHEIELTEKYDVTHYDLSIELSDLTNHIEGIVKTSIITLENLDTLLFELHENHSITNIKINSIDNNFIHENSSVKIPYTALQGSDIEITITYAGFTPSANLNPLSGSGLTNTLDTETNTNITYSLSEPFYAYEWWPCKQSLTDKADSCKLRITVPANCKAGSNGLLIDIDTLQSGKKTFIWKHLYPISYYLISVAVADYEEYSFYQPISGTDKSLLIQNYLYKNTDFKNKWLENINLTGEFTNLFSELFGPYPFIDEKYGHCTAPIGGGMEHQTMTTQQDFNKNLTAHELGHQWFGNNVTCSSWKDIWINEGFATYAQYLMLENLFPSEAPIQMIDYHARAMQYLDGSIFVLDSLNTNRIFNYRLTYCKGAAFIHTLRFIIDNDVLFFNTLRNFQNDYKGRSASAKDFKEYLLKKTTINFDEIFEELYYGEGFPTYSLRWNQSGNDLILELHQEPSGAFLTQLFTQPVEVKLRLSNSSDTIIRLNIEKNDQQYYFNNFGRVEQVTEIDPSNWIMNNIDTILMDTSLNNETFTNLENDVFEVYPNPTSTILQAEVHLDGINTLTIFDLYGKSLFETTFENFTEIDLNSLPNSTYIIELTTAEQQKYYKKISKI